MPRLHSTSSLLPTLALIALTIFGAGTAPAARPGEPDTSFDGDGWLSLNFGPSSRLTAVLELPASLSAPARLLAAGTPGGAEIQVRRLEMDGTVDASFGFLGQVSLVIPNASHAEVVKMLREPFGSGYLVLVQATRALDDEGVLLHLENDGSLDTGWPNGGFQTLYTSGPHAVTDLQFCCQAGLVMVTGQTARNNGYDAAIRILEADTGDVVSAPSWGEVGIQEAAFGAAILANGLYGAVFAADLSPDSIVGYRDDRPQNMTWSHEMTFSGQALDPRAAAGYGYGFVAASWVNSGLTGRPMRLSAWRSSGILIEPDPDFGTDGQALFWPSLGVQGYDALRPEEIVRVLGGFHVAATQLGAPNGPLRRVKTMRVAHFGDGLVWEGPALLGPDSTFDHDVTDMVTLNDGRLALAVTTTDRLDPLNSRGWVLIVHGQEVFRDGFETGDLAAWSAVVGGP